LDESGSGSESEIGRAKAMGKGKVRVHTEGLLCRGGRRGLVMTFVFLMKAGFIMCVFVSGPNRLSILKDLVELD